MANVRAVRYRRLALAEKDKATADLLRLIADECDRGILCTSEWLSTRLSLNDKQPLNAGDAKVRFDDPFN
jgi:hypothetical protein